MKRILQQRGFTLIELSIVLVIIGLVVGGVLAGQDLIRAAEARAQISQIEKYQTAVNTFRGKYGYLPGDIRDPDATNFGFVPRGTSPGEGDGNGILQGTNAYLGGHAIGSGELAVFWVDLSAAHLIDGTFIAGSPTALPASDVTGTAIEQFLPVAKIGRGNYVYVWSSGTIEGSVYQSSGMNYFGISGITEISSTDGKVQNTNANLTPTQALAIDTKMDDGFPLSGHVIAAYLDNDPVWADNVWPSMTDMLYSPPPTSTVASPVACFNNGGNPGTQQTYSVLNNTGVISNCALSFQFQ